MPPSGLSPNQSAAVWIVEILTVGRPDGWAMTDWSQGALAQRSCASRDYRSIHRPLHGPTRPRTIATSLGTSLLERSIPTDRCIVLSFSRLIDILITVPPLL